MNKDSFKSPIIITGLILFALIAAIGIFISEPSFRVFEFSLTSLYASLVNSQVLAALPIIFIVVLFVLSRIYSRPKFAAFGLFLLGIGMIVRLSFGIVGILDFNANKIDTTGKVFEIVKTVKNPCTRYQTCISYNPRIIFKTDTGLIVDFENGGSISDLIFANLFSFDGIDPLKIKIGDSLPVSYDRRNPTIAHVGQSHSTFLILVELGMILVVFVMGFITFRFSNKLPKAIAGKSK